MLSINKIEKYRQDMDDPLNASNPGDDHGMFFVPVPKPKKMDTFMAIKVSSGGGWEHVSITMHRKFKLGIISLDRTPTWQEMCFVKNLLWDENDTVIQYHPAKKTM